MPNLVSQAFKATKYLRTWDFFSKFPIKLSEVLRSSSLEHFVAKYLASVTPNLVRKLFKLVPASKTIKNRPQRGLGKIKTNKKDSCISTVR